jgi:hypothetical protein
VRGYADQMPRMKNNPTDPSNRRISILVKNDNDPVPALAAAKVVNGSDPLPAAAKTPSPAENGTGPQAQQPSAKPAAQPPVQAPLPAKPLLATPTAKPGMIDTLKAMMPGKKN